MPENLLNMLIQLPIVAVFIWYTERLYGKFEKFLVEERTVRMADRVEERISRQAYEKEMAQIITDLRERLQEHDEKLERAVTKMEERTKINSRTTARKTQ
jgi:cytochrome c-type biogenesis protein CcmH/NrfG